ncbi:MAG: peptidylprolyl isomerase [Bacteroidales bacterium]|jgi:peptidyl-prolyl cis-trans isomerase B (cyclophilin B)|nr:peptidylprolyl isomerase [Bacteroidales bacterium]MCI1784978.1 peptidylprolyl isomerase [Bacteroidales bacterium]
MKHIIVKSLCVIAASLLLAGCNNASKKAAEAARQKAVTDSLEQVKSDSIKAALMDKKQKEAMAIVEKLPEEPVFDIVTNLGTIKVKLYKKTPKHRANFAKLAISGFYDNLLFHRVINGFMIQGGDPYTKDTSKVSLYGQGGPGYTIPAEFVKEYVHKKGAIAAARRGDAANPLKESSGSQFYIVQNAQTCAQLNGDYTVFGETIDGLDVIDKIASVPTDRYDRPVDDVRIITIKLDESSKPKEKLKP